MMGETLDLADGETLIYGRNLSLDKNQPLRINGKTGKSNRELPHKILLYGHLPTGISWLGCYVKHGCQ